MLKRRNRRNLPRRKSLLLKVKTNQLRNQLKTLRSLMLTRSKKSFKRLKRLLPSTLRNSRK